MNYSGYWTGEIRGTNTGNFVLNLKQSGTRIEGVAKIMEHTLGSYEYFVAGEAAKEMTLKLTVKTKTQYLVLGNITAVSSLKADGTLHGRWKSEIGTEGI